MSVVLALDIGTTSTIGILIETEGRVLALADAPVTLHAPHPGWVEENLEERWRNVGLLCRALLAQSGIAPEM